MAVGSSVTLNDLSSKVIKDSLRGSYYNFSSWGLQIADDYKLIVNNVDKYTPRYVLITATFADFIFPENKSLTKNLDLIGTPRFEYFFKNYNNLESIICRWHELKTDSRANNIFTGLKFDEGGAIGFKIRSHGQDKKRADEARAIMNIFPGNYLQTNYAKLDSIGAFLQSKHVIFIFIQAPYASSLIESREKLQDVQRHFKECKAIVERHQGLYVNKEVLSAMPDSLFADPLHLSDKGAIVFTRRTVALLTHLIN